MTSGEGHDPLPEHPAYTVRWVPDIGGSAFLFEQAGLVFADADLSRADLARMLAADDRPV